MEGLGRYCAYDDDNSDVSSSVVHMPTRQSVGVYTAEPVQPDGAFVQALPKDASPKLQAVIRRIEHGICERLKINVEDLNKVDLSKKARNELLANAAYREFDLDVESKFINQAVRPKRIEAICATYLGGLTAMFGLTAAGMHVWPGILFGAGSFIAATTWSKRIAENASSDLPTVERAIQLKLDAKEKKYQL